MQGSKHNRISGATNILFFVFFILTSLVCLAPLAFVASISLSSEKSIQELGYSMYPKEFSIEAYVFLAQQSAIILRALFVRLESRFLAHCLELCSQLQ
jgi:putative aldouronate transport system permease protein